MNVVEVGTCGQAVVSVVGRTVLCHLAGVCASVSPAVPALCAIPAVCAGAPEKLRHQCCVLCCEGAPSRQRHLLWRTGAEEAAVDRQVVARCLRRADLLLIIGAADGPLFVVTV